MREVARGRIWIQEAPLHVWGYSFQTRMTVLRLADGGLWVHSPIAPDRSLQVELAAIGAVRHVVAPNRFHHLFLRRFIAAYPNARVYAAPGLAEKRKDVPFHSVLDDRPEPAWAAELDQAVFRGCRLMDEIVFYHRETRTLLLTDLCVNFARGSNPYARMILWLLGADRGLGPTRSLRWLTLDRPAARRSIARILEWDFDRILLAHGELVDTDGRARFEHAYAWL